MDLMASEFILIEFRQINIWKKISFCLHLLDLHILNKLNFTVNNLKKNKTFSLQSFQYIILLDTILTDSKCF